MATLLEQLEAMRGVKANWDGYGADPPAPAAIDLVADLVRLFAALRPGFEAPAVYVTPTRIGGVQVMWEDEGYEHELEVEPDGTIEVMHTERVSKQHTIRRFAPGNQPVTAEMLLRLRHLVAA